MNKITKHDVLWWGIFNVLCILPMALFMILKAKDNNGAISMLEYLLPSIIGCLLILVGVNFPMILYGILRKFKAKEIEKIQNQNPEAIIVSGLTSDSVFCMLGMFLVAGISSTLTIVTIMESEIAAAVLLAGMAAAGFGAMVYFFRFIRNRMLIIDSNKIVEITVKGEERIHKKEDFVSCKTVVYTRVGNIHGRLYGHIYFKDSKIYIGGFMGNIKTAINYIEKYYNNGD